MSTDPTHSAPQIDLEKIKAQVSSLSESDLREAVLKLRIREKKTQKKSYGSPNQKKYQLTQREKRKLMIELARSKGIMAEIDEIANDRAEEELAEEALAAKEEE